MKSVFLCSTLLASLTLTACGGDSGSSGTIATTVATTNTTEITPENARSTALTGTSTILPNTQAEILTALDNARSTARTCPSGTTYPAVTSKLTWNTTLEAIARGHAKDMADYDYFSHRSRNGSGDVNTDLKNRLAAADYLIFENVVENIAGSTAGSTIDTAVSQWISSASHCDSLMKATYLTAGVGYAYNVNATYDHYWVLLLSTNDQ